VTRWQDCDLEVKAECVPRYFWTTVSIDVYLGGLCILRTGGVLHIKGQQAETFKHNAENHVLELSWRSPLLDMSFPYQLWIDGQPIIAGRVRPGNWPLLFMPVAAIVLILIAVHFL
jgi:hypothetical protein